MNVILPFLKMSLVLILSLIGVVAVSGVLFLYLSPQFGGTHSEEKLASFRTYDMYDDGKFSNPIKTEAMEKLGDMWEVSKKFMKGTPNGSPSEVLPVKKWSVDEWRSRSQDKLIWFGHSAFYLRLQDKHILLDPMFGDSPSPLPFLGTKRFSDGLPIEVDSLPQIDLVIFSHDHYDHLDYPTIKKLKDRVQLFVVPLGVGSHLEEWGVDSEHIVELGWWDEYNFGGIQLACTPSRHFSGRGLADRNKTLWSSWVISSSDYKLYFSGDGGYGSHFSSIGEKYGPFDLALVECGQYNEMWKDIHMMPEESIQAAIDVKASLAMPIHWGSFTLALHTWDDPINRALESSMKLGMPITTPIIGEAIDLTSTDYPHSRWWESISE